jgi:hypothetical protein
MKTPFYALFILLISAGSVMSQNVGIGTTTPQFKLHTVGENGALGLFETTANDAALMQLRNPNSQNWNLLALHNLTNLEGDLMFANTSVGSPLNFNNYPMIIRARPAGNSISFYDVGGPTLVEPQSLMQLAGFGRFSGYHNSIAQLSILGISSEEAGIGMYTQSLSGGYSWSILAGKTGAEIPLFRIYDGAFSKDRITLHPLGMVGINTVPTNSFLHVNTESVTANALLLEGSNGTGTSMTLRNSTAGNLYWSLTHTGTNLGFYPGSMVLNYGDSPLNFNPLVIFRAGFHPMTIWGNSSQGTAVSIVNTATGRFWRIIHMGPDLIPVTSGSLMIGYAESENGEISAQVTIKGDGRVGFGGMLNPAVGLTMFNAPTTGEIAAYDYLIYSSGEWKKDIRPIENALDMVLALRGVYYKSTHEEEDEELVGFIAEEVEEVLPQVVARDEDNDVLGVSYSRITAVTINAIQELKALHDQDIARKDAELAELRQQVNELKEQYAQLVSALGALGVPDQAKRGNTGNASATPSASATSNEPLFKESNFNEIKLQEGFDPKMMEKIMESVKGDIKLNTGGSKN